jgi:hypothetical protein
MWGPALMVSPVIEQGATGREVRFVFWDINQRDPTKSCKILYLKMTKCEIFDLLVFTVLNPIFEGDSGIGIKNF